MVTVAAAAPRVRCVPPAVSSLGSRAVELGRECGVVADPWQADVLEAGCGVREDGKWAAFEVGVNVPRQNGKGGVLELRVLVGLFELGERLIIWSSQQGDTSLEAFYRLVGLIDEAPELAARVKEYRYGSGREGIRLVTGERIRFMTRSKSRARGFAADLLILDEAMFLPEFTIDAMLPTLSARPNPQVWYAGSAVDQQIHDQGVVWARVRERGAAGKSESLAYVEYSADAESPESVSREMLEDESVWAAANPALGIRISAEHVGHELAAMDSRGFAVERLGVGDWPRTDHVSSSMIDLEDWDDLADRRSVVLDPVVLAFDVSPDRRASIAAAGRRKDGLFHVEIVRNEHGTGWVVPALLELVEKHEPVALVCDAYGPVASLVAACVEAGLHVQTVTVAEHAQACGRLVDAVSERTVRHLGSGELTEAVRGAATRPLGDSWAWSRKSSSVDISPLVSVTLALWCAMNEPEAGEVTIW